MPNQIQSDWKRVTCVTSGFQQSSMKLHWNLHSMESPGKCQCPRPLVLKASGTNAQGVPHLPTTDAGIELLLPFGFLGNHVLWTDFHLLWTWARQNILVEQESYQGLTREVLPMQHQRLSAEFTHAIQKGAFPALIHSDKAYTHTSVYIYKIM